MLKPAAEGRPCTQICEMPYFQINSNASTSISSSSQKLVLSLLMKLLPRRRKQVSATERARPIPFQATAAVFQQHLGFKGVFRRQKPQNALDEALELFNVKVFDLKNSGYAFRGRDKNCWVAHQPLTTRSRNQKRKTKAHAKTQRRKDYAKKILTSVFQKFHEETK
ncbi:hypothetical protein L0337_45790 [candidate division KSB1 bacterium]|nr:hypothetical protein [candidate division KSB1 bacterium]